MADLILVHGAMHGAWCWDRLIPELVARGHNAFAVDMPVDRPGLSIKDYADHVLAAVAGRGLENAYLVGHSMGGYVIPLVAAGMPSTRLIFLCAVLTHTNESELRENMDATSPDFVGWLRTDAEGRVTLSPEHALEGFYKDVDPEVAAWAISKLRPQWPVFTTVRPAPPYADRVAGVIYTLDDRIVLADVHRKLALERFGKEPIALPGDHSPFLSRPADLAAALERIAATDKAAS